MRQITSEIVDLIKELDLFDSSHSRSSHLSPFQKANEILRQKNQEANRAGGIHSIRKYHASGKMTVRERIDYFFDPGTFHEIDKYVGKTIMGDGVITGWGFVKRKKIFIFAWDFTVIAGTCGHDNANKIVKIHDLAQKERCPIIGLNDSGGARIQEGMLSLAAYSRIFYGNSSKLSGRVPQISLIMGNCAGGAVYSPAMTDFIIMTQNSFMAITGPVVLKAATGIEVTAKELGGAEVQEENSGVVHISTPDDRTALNCTREMLEFLPQNYREKPDIIQTKDPLCRPTTFSEKILETAGESSFDMRCIVVDVLDDRYYFEIQKNFARNITIGFGRIAGISVGIIGNNSRYKAGCLDIDASCKAARFVNFCNIFNIPIINFVDVPGFFPSLEQEKGGIIRHGAKLLFAQCIADIPKISIIVRKSFGGAYCVMLSKDIKADRVFSLPSASLAVMGAAGAVDIIYRRDLLAIKDKKQREEKRQSLIDQYNETHLNPWEAAREGKIDEIIYPSQMREVLTRELPSLFSSYDPSKTDRKFPNFPL